MLNRTLARNHWVLMHVPDFSPKAWPLFGTIRGKSNSKVGNYATHFWRRHKMFMSLWSSTNGPSLLGYSDLQQMALVAGLKLVLFTDGVVALVVIVDSLDGSMSVSTLVLCSFGGAFLVLFLNVRHITVIFCGTRTDTPCSDGSRNRAKRKTETATYYFSQFSQKNNNLIRTPWIHQWNVWACAYCNLFSWVLDRV